MNDPLIDEIRRARREISDEIGPDLVGLVEHYAEIERHFLKPALTAKEHISNRVNKLTEQDGPADRNTVR
jgi:hypothetical protein